MAKSRKSNRSKDKDDTNEADATHTDTVTADTAPTTETIEATAEDVTQSDETNDTGDTSVPAVSEEVLPETTQDGDIAAEPIDAEPSEKYDTSETPETDATVSGDGEQGDDSLMSDDTAAADQADDTLAASSDTDTVISEELEVSAEDTVEAVESDAPEEDASSPSETDTAPAPALVPAAPPPQRTSSAWPAIFGGVVAALLGFIAGRADQIDAYLPASMQRQPVDLTEIEAQTVELTAADEALQSRVAALENAESAPVAFDSSEIEANTAEIQSSVSDLAQSLSALTERVEALESAPAIEVPTDGATTDDVAALQSALDAQRAEIEALASQAAEAEAKAASEASKILARAALARVMTAVDTGETFSPALGDLEQVAPVDVPEPLRTAAETGVPRLSDLQSSFPDAARAALGAIRRSTPEADVQGVQGFLRRTLSARSVTPRDGDDPDAVLSRAEAQVRLGDLGAALEELEMLPEAGRVAMDEWLQAATARKAAQDAARSLSDSLNN